MDAGAATDLNGSPEKVRLEKRDRTALLTLHAPAARNALDPDLCRALSDALDALSSDPAVHAVILTGAGPAFSAGSDVKRLQEELDRCPPDQRGPTLARLTRPLLDLIRRIMDMDKPFLAAVNGPAAGGGLSLALACDMVVAAATAVFDPAYVRLGLVPVGGVSWIVLRQIGLKRAAEFLLRAEPIPAQEALSLGLINQVVPPERLLTETLEVAKGLADLPPMAVARTKRLLQRAYDRPLPDHMLLELEYLETCAETRDHQMRWEALLARLT